MEIIKVDLSNKKEVREFIKLPLHIYAGVPQWVPPLDVDANMVMDPNHHSFYKHSEAVFFICRNNGQPVGRLAVLKNNRYNDYNHSKTAFFYLFEAENNKTITQALFEEGFCWASHQGLTDIIGPKGFSVLDGMGMLVDGFEHRPAYGLPYNPPYYPALIESAGFIPDSDVVSGYLDPKMEFPSKIHELSARIQHRRGLRIARFNTKKDLRKLIPHLKDMYNGALEGTTGNYPLDDADLELMAKQLLWFADPKLIKIVMKISDIPGTADKPVGFLLAYPDISAALQKINGKLLPFGWITMLMELKRTEWVNINGAGMLAEYRGLGGTAILFSEMYKTINESGQFKHADLVQIGVDNERMQREMRDFGVTFYKRHRMYRRLL